MVLNRRALSFGRDPVVAKLKQSQVPADSRQIISTCGEVFPDGTFIDVVRPADMTAPNLVVWRHAELTAGLVAEHNGLTYKPLPIHGSILRLLRLPAAAGSFGSDRDLHGELCAQVVKFAGLAPKFSSLISRFVLATWVLEALENAPVLVLVGPDSERANQIVRLLHCLCRRALPVTAASPSSICTLPSGMRFTLLIRQPSISPKLSNVLQAATRRDAPILRDGKLLDLFGAQVISCDAGIDGWPGGVLPIPCVPSGDRLPALDKDTQQRIAQELQPKLLAYRFARYAQASVSRFDTSKFAMPLRGLASTLAAVTPGDAGLQNELHSLLEDENTEINSANWIDLNTVIIEALLVFCREAKNPGVYVGEIADMATAILKGHGEIRELDPGEVGRRLKSLGFVTAPRDARGVRLELSNKVCVQVQVLANQLNVPGAKEACCVGM